MLHDTREVDGKDGSVKILTSLFVNRKSLPDLNLPGATLKTTLAPGGKEPGPDAEILVEVTFPRKVVQAAPAVPKPLAPPAPPVPAAKH